MMPLPVRPSVYQSTIFLDILPGSGVLDGGVLAAGGKVTVKSPAVTMTAAGKLINTATVDGASVDYPSYDVPYASDTATVNVEQALVTCPTDFQEAVNKLGETTDDFTYAVLNNPKKPEEVSVCVPTMRTLDGSGCAGSVASTNV